MRTFGFHTVLLVLGTGVMLSAQSSRPGSSNPQYTSGLTPITLATSWSTIVQNGRPPWVSPSAERRLRLLQVLPGIEATLSKQASGYFGSSGPGMSVGLVLDDGLYYSRGFGFRDMQKSQVPDEGTVYCVGSLTKVFTGTTLLVLRDASNSSLALDDDASRYVPEIVKVRMPNSCGPVKLRHLVSHTSGLPNVMSPAEADEPTWLKELQNTKLAFCPGSFSAYSGVGVEMVGLIIERATGQPYTEAATQLLLNPLGMKHSVFGPANVEVSHKAQNWRQGWNGSFTSPTFTADSSWGNPQMLTPAGNLFSSVWDLALFHQMWLSMQAPSGILKLTTLQSSGQSAVSASTQPIPTTCGTFDDGAGSSFSSCRDAAAFGVNWFVGQPPFIQHNGSVPPLCGSNSILNPSQKIGATGVISTDPFPSVPLGQTQPAGTVNFMGTVVSTMLSTAQAADTATDWKTSPLAVGVARLLWLLGTKMPASTLGCKPPTPHGQGAPLYPGMNKPHECNQQAFQQFGAMMLAHFGRAYRAKYRLDSQSVVDHVFNTLRKDIGPCSTFRVRGAPASNQVRLRLHCAPARFGGLMNYDLTLTVENSAPYRIAEIDNASVTAEPF